MSNILSSFDKSTLPFTEKRSCGKKSVEVRKVSNNGRQILVIKREVEFLKLDAVYFKACFHSNIYIILRAVFVSVFYVCIDPVTAEK